MAHQSNSINFDLFVKHHSLISIISTTEGILFAVDMDYCGVRDCDSCKFGSTTSCSIDKDMPEYTDIFNYFQTHHLEKFI